MPPEWHPHQACLISWPCLAANWGLYFHDAKKTYHDVITAISQVENVMIIVDPSTLDDFHHHMPHISPAYCDHTIKIIECPLDDSWIRDNGPVFLKNTTTDAAPSIMAIDFAFNQWGHIHAGKDGFNQTYSKDQKATKIICETLDIHCHTSNMIMEGGAFHTNGTDIVMTTKECLLNHSRNGWSQQETGHALLQNLGFDPLKAHLLWLDHGIEDDETSGHIDNMACFIDETTILHAVCDDPSDPNHARTYHNIDYVHDFFIPHYKRETGTDLRLKTLSLPPELPNPVHRDKRMALSYINFYRANHNTLIFPQFGRDTAFLEKAGLAQHKDALAEADERANAQIKMLFPDHPIHYSDALPLLIGGGGIHCITQQMPA